MIQDFIATYDLPLHHVHNPYLALLVTFIFLYTNNVTLIAVSKKRLKQLLHTFGWFTDTYGMHIN